MPTSGLSNTPFLDQDGKVSRPWLQFLTMLENSVDLPPVTFAHLPARPPEGELAVVSDSTTNVWGAVIAGGGTNAVLAWYNGTHWTVAGK